MSEETMFLILAVVSIFLMIVVAAFLSVENGRHKIISETLTEEVHRLREENELLREVD